MTLGKPGGGRDPEFFFQPNDVLAAPNGDISSRRPQQRCRSHGARPEVFERRQVDQDLRQAGNGAGRVRSAARAGDGFEGASVCGRSEQQSDSDFRIRTASSSTSGNSSAGPAESTSTRMTISMLPIPSPSPFPRITTDGKRGIRVGSAKDGSVKYFIPDPSRKRPPPAPPKASLRMRKVIFMVPKSVPAP